jgi:hypothetical protein
MKIDQSRSQLLVSMVRLRAIQSVPNNAPITNRVARVRLLPSFARLPAPSALC